MKLKYSIAVGMFLGLATHIASAQSTNIVSTGGKDISSDPQGQIVFIAGNDFLIRSTDGGSTWSLTETPYLEPERVLVRFDNPEIVLVAKRGEIGYSLSAGSEWTIALQDTQTIPLRFSQSFVNPNVMFLTRSPIDSIVVIMMSQDGGLSWAPHSQFTPLKNIYDIEMYPYPNDTLWGHSGFFCGQGAQSSSGPWDGYWHGVYHPPSASYWFTQSSVVWPPLELDITSFALLPERSSTYPTRLISANVPSARDTIFSNNDFSSSERIPIFWEADSIRMIRARKGTNHIFVATDRGIFRSTDEGTTWEQKNLGMPDTNIQAIGVPNAGNKVFAVGRSTSSVSTDNGDSWNAIVTNVSSLSDVPKKYLLNQNYPNPFNPTTNIKFQIPSSNFASLEVYNVLGQRVRTLIQEKREAGEHTVQFDASGLPSGVYVYRLRAGEFSESRKMILVR